MRSGRRLEMKGARIRRSMGVASAAMLVAAAGALAAGTLKPGALYTGKSSACGSSVAGTTCVFRFRASADGRSLRFVGKTVIDTWRCRGGGGEALLGGTLKNAKPTPIPVVRVRANGALYGSVGYTLRPTGAPPAHYTSSVTGHLANAGREAVITFHNVYRSSHGNQPCATQPATLTGR
jgi:hypothetical protein